MDMHLIDGVGIDTEGEGIDTEGVGIDTDGAGIDANVSLNGQGHMVRVKAKS